MSLSLAVREPTPEDFIRACQKDTSVKDETPIDQDKLTRLAIDKLLSRADPIEEAEEIDATEFKQRPKTKPAPQSGDIIQISFPPNEPLKKPPELLIEEETLRRELKVIRYMPESEDLETVPQVVVTFNQPMVPVTSVDELKNFPVPVEMTPHVEGEWRWVGTKTVKWKPNLTHHPHRLPKSTNFEVFVPSGSGTSSQWDCQLSKANEVRFHFSTQKLKLTTSYPSNSSSTSSSAYQAGPNTMVYLQFNQQIDPEYILTQIQLCECEGSQTVEGGESQGINLGITMHLMSLDQVRSQLDSSGPGCEPEESYLKKKRHYMYQSFQSYYVRSKSRSSVGVEIMEIPFVDFMWIGFDTPLDLDCGYVVKIPAGTRSAEGPRLSDELSCRFRTYGRFRLKERYPRLDEKPCLPLSGWSLTFTNNIELDSFDTDKHIRIEPEMDDVVISPSGATLSIRGRSKGRTLYKVTIDASLADVFGQVLGSDVVEEFNVGPARQSLSGFFPDRVIVHDVTLGGDDPTFSIVSCNLPKARVIVYQVHPSEFHRSSFGADYYHHRQARHSLDDLTPEQVVNAGTQVFDAVVELNTEEDEMGETAVHLREHLQDVDACVGQLVVYVEPDRESWSPDLSGINEWRLRPKVKTWIQVTKTAVMSFSSSLGQVYCFAADLADGTPVDVEDAVQFTVQPALQGMASRDAYEAMQVSVPAAADGMALLTECYGKRDPLVFVTRGSDIAFVRGNGLYGSCNDRWLSYVINDRNLYKPKETVNIKGILRLLSHDGVKKVLSIPDAMTLTYQARDARGNVFSKGDVQTSAHGSFFLDFELPDDVNLGAASVSFQGFGHSQIYHPFKIQEFRTPEFSARSTVPKGPYFIDGISIVTSTAEYFSGGGMQGCEVRWDVTQSDSSYTPPGYSFQGYSFSCGWRPLAPPKPPEGEEGASAPPNRFGFDESTMQLLKSKKDVLQRLMKEELLSSGSSMSHGGTDPMMSILSKILPKMGIAVPDKIVDDRKGELTGKTDAEGEHKLCIEFLGRPTKEIRTPVSITSLVNIQDINRQTMSSTSSFLVHPSKYYVGLKLKKSFCAAGDPLPLDIIVTNLDGEVVETEVTLKVVSRWCERKGWDYVEKEEVLDTVIFVSEQDAKELTIRMPEGGEFHLVASVKDEDGMVNFASSSIWVSGGTRGKPKLKGGSRISREDVKLIANKNEYLPGDVAKILVTAPFDSPCEGVYFVICNGFSQKSRFQITEGRSAVIEVPIQPYYIPGAQLCVHVYGAGDRIDERTGRPSSNAPKRPAYASATLRLTVPSTTKKLIVEVEPEKAIMKPGEDGVVNVVVKPYENEEEGESSTEEAENFGPGSLVSCIIVDEAVLSLTGYELPHPISTFYPSNDSHFSVAQLHSSVVMKDWSSISVQGPVPPPVPPCEGGCDCFGYGGMGGGGGLCCGMGSGSRFCACSAPCVGYSNQGCRCSQQQQQHLRSSSSSCIQDTSATTTTTTTGCARPRCCCCDECDGCNGCECAAAEDFGGMGGEEVPSIEVRTNFNPLAIFVHDALVVNAEGKVSIPFTLPDNLTRYRVWVLATNGSTFYGLGESSLQAQLPVSVRPSLPRFLNFGDQSDFSVVLQNQTVGSIRVAVACRMTNLQLIDETSQGYEVEIPVSRRAEIRFPVKTKACGTARFQVVAAVRGTEFADAVVKDLPVYTPSTSEAFATYGELDGTAAMKQPIIPPPAIFNQFGGLTVTTSSTALQALTDAFLYLVHYKFDCVEQASSRMLSICALQNILHEFNVPSMPSLAELEQVIATSITKIKRAQRQDGAIGFWTITSNVNIYLSIFVCHALLRASLQGYEVDPVIMNRSKTFCQNVQTYIDQYAGWYGPSTRASLRSFALYVLALFALNDKLTPHEQDLASGQATEVWGSLKEYLTHEGRAWLALSLFACSPEKVDHPVVKEILLWVMTNVNEEPETANFITSYGDDGKLVMLHSNRRTDAVMLELLIYTDEKNQLIPKIVKGLLAHRKKGRWTSTQENVYILLALKKYFEVFEKIVPDFISRIWLGEDYCGEVEFRGRETDYKAITIPMNVLIPDSEQEGEIEEDHDQKDLVLWKQGEGRLYYRIGMDYAPKSLDLKPIDYGFIVERSYEHVTDPFHVTRDRGTGTWTFVAGEMIRVKLRLTNVSRRYHVALVDYIPAGCEVLNPDLQGGRKPPPSVRSETGSSSTGSPFRRHYGWWHRWYEHVNRRDERVEAFASYLYCGQHEYEYLMTATALGEYVVPPAKAEEMYAPELFGRSASEKVIIKEE